ncbi:MAG: 16S rRNA (cytosine(1402)-N(4))-methyltransferase RsmH [Syntrophomonadaceae bacterium]|nr:16S rRNA (cytosine(1402)-N(4))-methyltransferase RsmH [Syntrophomonadaceae bacterium]
MHKPVLLEPTISHLVTDTKGIYVDLTLGGGGHLRALLEKLDPEAQVIAFDKDEETMLKTQQEFDTSTVKFINTDFKFLIEVLNREKIDKVSGIMADLGVSSFQLDEAERGFSFHEEALLDMRMNRNQQISAWHVVNEYSEAEIIHLLFIYGEEKYARQIARKIVNQRVNKPIDTTLQLVEIIKAAVPASYRREKHPARKTFQAIRIAVNDELQAIELMLPQAVEVLKPNGRLCIITFHSLEDRIVKKFIQENSRDCVCPPGYPICICGHTAKLKPVTRKPIVPSSEECEGNPRARSAKLRVASRVQF